MHFNLRHILQTLLLICLSVQACYGNPLAAGTTPTNSEILPVEEVTAKVATTCNDAVSATEKPQLMMVTPAAAQAQCIANHGYCQSAAQCCSKRCLTYAAKCVPSGALAAPKIAANELETPVENE